MVEKIVNDLNQEFGIAPNSVEAQRVLEETQKQVEALQIDEKYRKALLENAEAIKLEQSKISLSVAEKLYADDIRLENLRKEAQKQKEIYENSINKQAYNAIEQTTPSADANKLAVDNFDNKVVSSQIIRELTKNESQIAKDNQDILEDVKEEKSILSKITDNIFGKKTAKRETQDSDSFELSDEKELKQIEKNLSDDKSLDDLKDDVKAQSIEEPAKLENISESVSFNQVLSFIRDKNIIESPFADGTFSNKANQKALYNNFSKMDIKELRELLADIKAKNAMLEQQIENLKSGVAKELSNELEKNEQLLNEKKADGLINKALEGGEKETQKVQVVETAENELKKTTQSDTKTAELINNIQEIMEPKVENTTTQSENVSNDMASETRNILSNLAGEYNIVVDETVEKSEPKNTIDRKSELDKLKNIDLDAVMATEQSSDDKLEEKHPGNHYTQKYANSMK